jgi:hypothetical protein
MALRRDYLVRILQLFMISNLLSFCGVDQPAVKNQEKGDESTDFNYAVNSVIFNPEHEQNYAEFIFSDSNVILDTLPAEYRTLLGLAHLYHGELFEVTSQILAHMQLDIYEGSYDLAHGEKFPINYQNIEHQDEMNLWRGIDASEIYGYNIGSSIISRIQSTKNSDIKSTLDDYYKHGLHAPIYDQTFLTLSSGRKILAKQSLSRSLALQIELEDMYINGNYSELLIRLQDFLGKDIFPDETQFIYFNSMLFKLAALSHYQLGVKTLERSLNDTSSLPDSSVYRLITIMNLATQYDSFDESEKISKLWSSHKDVLVSNAHTLTLIVKDHFRKPFSVDWMHLLNALTMNIPNFTIPPELAHLDFRNDNFATSLMKYFADYRNSERLSLTKDIIDQLVKNPSLLDKYPTVMSVFIQKLNLSPLSMEYKTQIQNISELIVFNVGHSTNSWQRNRPAFLISLYGTLRWHGSRLPNCNGFLQDMVSRFPSMVSLSRITGLFTQQVLYAKFNSKKATNT